SPRTSARPPRGGVGGVGAARTPYAGADGRVAFVAVRRNRRAEGGEPAADRVVQVARRPEQVAGGRALRGRRGRGVGGEPRPVARVRGAGVVAAVLRLHAGR